MWQRKENQTTRKGQGGVNETYASWDTRTVFSEEGLSPLTFSKDRCGIRSYHNLVSQQLNSPPLRCDDCRQHGSIWQMLWWLLPWVWALESLKHTEPFILYLRLKDLNPDLYRSVSAPWPSLSLLTLLKTHLYRVTKKGNFSKNNMWLQEMSQNFLEPPVSLRLVMLLWSFVGHRT